MRYVQTLIVILVAFSTFSAQAAEQLNVVATLSSFGDLVKQIAGDHAHVDVVAPAKFNPHFIAPRPSDVLKLKRADVFAWGGLDLEAWKVPLLTAAGNENLYPNAEGDINLAEGVRLLEVPDHKVSRSEGDIHLYGNPHFWLSPENGLIMAGTIARRLGEIDPDNAQDYEANLDIFTKKLRAKIEEWKKEAAPYTGTELIAYHNQWPYLMEFLGLTTKQFLESKPGIPPGPRQLKSLQDYIKNNSIPGIIWSAVYAGKSAKALSKRSGAPIIQLAQGVGEVKKASDYIAMIDYDVNAILSVLKAEK